MTTESANAAERSRKLFSIVLRRARSVGQNHLADAIGVSESTISKMFDDGRIERACEILAALDLKLVPKDAHCYRADQLEPIFQIAKQTLERAKHVDDILLWDDPE